jgi:cytidyltransferase-like protein
MEANQPKTGKHCITYGTIDLFHKDHRRLLQRARTLGSQLTVAVTSDTFDLARVSNSMSVNPSPNASNLSSTPAWFTSFFELRFEDMVARQTSTVP